MRASRTTMAIVVPEGLLFAVAVALLRIPSTRALIDPLLDVLPVLTIIVGALLSVRFRRLQIFMALVALALVDRGLIYLSGDAVPGLLGTVLPFVLFVLALGDGGFESWSGRLSVLIVTVALAITLLLPQPIHTLPAIFDFPLVPEAFHQRVGLPALGIVAYGGAGFTMVILVAARHDRVVRGLLWCLVASFFGFAVALDRTSYFTVAGVILIVALVEDAYALAYRDALTKLPSRRALDDMLKRLHPPFTVALVDVDHFKRFNDRYGHDVGDQVLQMVARHLGAVGGAGQAYRYGGEEFAIVFRGKKLDACEDHLEQVRAGIDDARFLLRAPDRPKKRPSKPAPRIAKPKQISVTVSVGVAQSSDALPTSLEVVDAADKALYRAKRAGRNRITTERRKKRRS